MHITSSLFLQNFSEILDDLSQEALLGQLLSDPFLSERSEVMDEDEDLNLSSSPHPHIQVEHSYSLTGDSHSQPPISHLATESTAHPGEYKGSPVFPVYAVTYVCHSFCCWINFIVFHLFKSFSQPVVS